MAGLYNIFGPNKILNSLEEHSNCHVVVDGSNLQYCFWGRSHVLSNLPAYEKAARNFFKTLLNANITPHVFFDGPSRGDPHKWERSKTRRQDRLERLIYRSTNFEGVFEYPQPTAIQDIFRDVIESMGIRLIQVSANRDYLLEMVSHAKHFDAFLISGNTKFYAEDIPRGFVCPQRNFFVDFECAPKCIMETFHFRALRQLIGLESSRNPYALRMWMVVLFNPDIFGLFSKPFFGKERRPPHFPKGHCFWMGSILSDKCRKVGHLKLLQFFLENTRSEAERIVKSQLYPDRREEASLLFAQSIAAFLLEPYDVFQRIERQIETDTFCDEDLPRWFLRYLTVECKVIPGLMDVLTDRRHHLMTLLEDYDKPSVNKTTLRLRRIAYGILFADRDVGDGGLKILELDRVGDKLEETHQTPILYLWDPEGGSEPEEVPGLKDMDSLPQSTRAHLFFLSMGIGKDSLQGIPSNSTLYVTSILRYWIVANSDIEKIDLLRILLTVLCVEQEYSKSSNVFAKAVNLHENAASELGVQFDADSVSDAEESFACMHPLALLQNATLFGRTLHRLFMQPLGAMVDSIETITSEIAFFHLYQKTEHMDAEELGDFILQHMDEESRNNFTETVNAIWDENALEAGRYITRGYRGDDKRP